MTKRRFVYDPVEGAAALALVLFYARVHGTSRRNGDPIRSELSPRRSCGAARSRQPFNPMTPERWDEIDRQIAAYLARTQP